jgi:hypothetical protein
MTKNIKAEGPNRDSIDNWNGPQGQNWVDQNPLSEALEGDRRLRLTFWKSLESRLK